LEKTVYEEIVIPEQELVLSSKKYKTTEAGIVSKEVRVSFCSWCQRRISQSEKTTLCCVCHRVLCDEPSCAIALEGRHYCRDDLQRVLPMNKLHFLLVHGLLEGLTLDEVKELSRSGKEDFRSAINQATTAGLIEKKGIGIFSRCEVSHLGVLCWRTHYPGFAQDGDVAYFFEEVQRHHEEVNANERKRNSGKGR
jgi:hypothetical protein